MRTSSILNRYPRTTKDTLRKDEDKRIKKRKDVEGKKREKEMKKEE
jgi:hypothetical protein